MDRMQAFEVSEVGLDDILVPSRKDVNTDDQDALVSISHVMLVLVIAVQELSWVDSHVRLLWSALYPLVGAIGTKST